MSVSGNVTTMSIQVINTGNNPEKLELFGIHGDFTYACSVIWSNYDRRYEKSCDEGTKEVEFLPGEPHLVVTTTTVSECAPRHISLVNSTDWENNLANPIVMNPGQCLMFSFSGTIMTGNHILVPSLDSGKEFVVHVFASKADSKIDCYFQKSSSPSCSVDHDDDGSD